MASNSTDLFPALGWLFFGVMAGFYLGRLDAVQKIGPSVSAVETVLFGAGTCDDQDLDSLRGRLKAIEIRVKDMQQDN